MTIRALAAGAAVIFLAGPAFADCAQEAQKLDSAIVAHETGAAADDSAMPASPHQQQVLEGDKEGDKAAEESGLPATQHQEEVLSGDKEQVAETTGSTGNTEAVSPHQRQVVRELDEATRTQASDLVKAALEKAQAGDEQGCRAQLAEAKALLGTE
ncbi:MAG: hypothetical protein WD100_04700 [Tistlia sp.]|uniref:hypothetical protein n=1 Tax=Tistlia sp. TaxID=3057121 RepID=UPI0034A27940